MNEESRPGERRLPSESDSSTIADAEDVEFAPELPDVRLRASWTAKDLMREVFPEPRYAVPGVLA